jgi:ribosomal protein S2
MSQLRNKGIQIGAQNHEDDLEMDDFLESEMKRIDEKHLKKTDKVDSETVSTEAKDMKGGT